MSDTAIWRNREHKHLGRRSCSNIVDGDLIVCGDQRDSGMAPGLVKYGTFRVLNNRQTRSGRNHLYPPEMNLVMTQEEADALNQLHSRSTPYTRNCIKFVSSRAARRRGIVPTDWFFLSRQKRLREQYAKKAD